MNELPELFYVRTIPLTGTHFLLDMLELADPSELRVKGYRAGRMQNIIQEAIEKRMLYSDLMANLLNKYEYPITLKYFGIFDHLYTPGNRWTDRLETYLKCQLKTIVTLRHYRDTVLTNLLYTTKLTKKLEEGRGIGLGWCRSGYEFLADHTDDDYFFFIPIDLLGGCSVERRRQYVKKCLSEFIGVDRIKWDIFDKFCIDWKPIHTMEDSLDIETIMESDDEFKVLIEIKDSGKDIRGIHEEYDREMEFYENHDEIQRMFDRYGYER